MIIVDEARYPYRGQMYCHMMSDLPNPTDELRELIAFARKIGLSEYWLQNHPTHPHFDLSPSRRARAIQAGAKEVTSRDMMQMYRNRIMKEAEA